MVEFTGFQKVALVLYLKLHGFGAAQLSHVWVFVYLPPVIPECLIINERSRNTGLF